MATLGNPEITLESHKLSTRPLKTPKPVRLYACSLCQKTFKRSEHCSRHERGHSHEKPFPCRHCGRRYARKDLVSRHEKSFHPFELARRQSSVDTDTVIVTVNQNSKAERSDEAQPSTQQIRPDSSNSRSERRDEQFTEPNLSPAMAVTAQASTQVVAGLHSTDEQHASVLADFSMATSGPFSMPISTSGPNMNQFLGSSQTLIIDNQSLNDIFKAPREKSVDPVAGSSTTPTQVSVTSQNIPTGRSWDSSRSNWPEAETLDGDDFPAEDPNHIPVEHPVLDRQMENYFHDVDIFSMLPNCGTNLEANFSISSYLFNSGYSPPIENTPVQQSRWDTRKRSGSTTHASIGAVAEPFRTSSAAGCFTRLPTVVNETPRKIPVPVVDDEMYALIVKDVRARLSNQQEKEFNMPNSQSLQRFLTSYFTCFHRHFPIIHLPSLDLTKTPSPLILSMCAIGALYRLSRKTAKDLWFWADIMVENELRMMASNLMSPSTITAVQCKLLLGLFAVFSGDVTVRALAKLGYWTTEYRLRKVALNLRLSNIQELSWREWTLRETSKRLLYGIFIMSSLMTVTYDMTPSFSVTQDIDLEMPDEERLWEAMTGQQWEESMKSRRPWVPTTIRDAMTHLIFGKEHSTSGADPISWSGFATTVILHAVNVHMWNIMQFTQSFTSFAVDEQNNVELRACLVSQVETALARCYTLLTADRSEREHTSDDSEGPLVFNCLALLRSAYVRVFTGAGSFNRMILLSEDSDQVADSIQSYIAGPQERSSFLTKAVDKAYGGLLTPIKAGYLLVRKTAALSWSVEHAVAAWDCALFVTKWIHAMEIQQVEQPPNDEELKNLANFRGLLNEVDSDYDGKGSLASEVTRVWACFLDDTWVWGITPRMGHVLRRLSAAFAEDWKRKYPNGNEHGCVSR